MRTPERFPVLIVIALVAIASGCMSTETDVHVSSDADIEKVQVQATLYDEFYRSLEQSPEPVSESLKSELRSRLESDGVDPGTISVEKTMEDGNHSYIFTMENIRLESGSGIEVRREGEQIVYNETMREAVFVVETYTVHMPGEVLETNGEKQGDKAVFTGERINDVDYIYARSEKSGGIISSLMGFFSFLGI